MPTHSQQIRFDDARTIFTIVGECRDLWADPAAWQSHLLRRAAAFAGCRIGLCYEVKDSPDERASQMLSAADAGWLDAGERCTLVEGLALQKLSYSPLWAAFADGLDRDAPVTFRQEQLIDNRIWHQSEMYDRYVRPTRIGQGMMSGVWMPHRATWSVWCLTNDRTDRAHTERQRLKMSLLHQEIAPLIGTVLCAACQRSLAGLTELRRKVLLKLLAGETEQEIADAMYRSRAAIHEHVAYLYDHFAVSSRSQLSAYFVARRPADNPRADSFDHVKDWLEQ